MVEVLVLGKASIILNIFAHHVQGLKQVLSHYFILLIHS